jgi:hypothetical protein
VPTIIVRHCPFTAEVLRAAPITASIVRATTNGASLLTSYTPYPFPARDGVDAVVYFFYLNQPHTVGAGLLEGANVLGQLAGGKFDYWRTGGQEQKSLVNVVDGYGGHVMPTRGAPCWTMISSMDGTQRSNTCRVVWT